MKSVMSRWGTILECTNRFYGCYTQIANRNESEKNEQDRVCVAYLFLLGFVVITVHIACMFNSHIHLYRYWMHV
jgi:hypothetical protein